MNQCHVIRFVSVFLIFYLGKFVSLITRSALIIGNFK